MESSIRAQREEAVDGVDDGVVGLQGWPQSYGRQGGTRR